MLISGLKRGNLVMVRMEKKEEGVSPLPQKGGFRGLTDYKSRDYKGTERERERTLGG